jgi:hypothetical protein
MPHSITTVLLHIVELEAERAAIYARAGERRWLDEHERARLVDIRRELAQLWDQRQAEKAGAREGAMPDVVRSEQEFAAPSARGYYRSRRRGGRTWAEAEALLELEVGR